jgi:hypothetical protein
MWQIPLIELPLTSEFWFGDSKVDGSPGFRLTAASDVGLIVALQRLCYIIGKYLTWLQQASPRGYVEAVGIAWHNRSKGLLRWE